MDNEILIQQLEATGDYKVIRRFEAPDHYASLDGVDLQQLRIAMIIDTETTGLNKETDKIIDLGFVLAEFNAKTGQVHRIVERYSCFEDPGMPIPASITQLTGIQDADLAGQVLDEARVEAAIARASVVIAHNAAFDRGFLERRFPSFVSKWWACSQKEASLIHCGHLAPSSKDIGSKRPFGAFVLPRSALEDNPFRIDFEIDTSSIMGLK